MLCCAVPCCAWICLQVPVACATYLDDMYVDYNLAQETLRELPSARQWVTNEFKHRCAGWVGGGLGGGGGCNSVLVPLVGRAAAE
jgi:hypothetical protein